MTGVFRLLLCASLVCAGCSRSPARPEQARAGDAVAEHDRVCALLYDQSLIEDPEVQVKMSEYVVRMRRDSLPDARGYREFREWLEEWVRRNPERARAAQARRPVEPEDGS